MRIFMVVGSLLGLLFPNTARAVPGLLTHHGYLTLSGAPVEGPVQVTFALYDGASATSAAWSETTTVDCVQGYYSVVLGRQQPLDGPTLGSLTAPFLGLAIESAPELVPRLPVNSVPYAVAAGLAEVASDVVCLGCIGAPEVAFSYAGSTSAGGAAEDLACTSASGCIETMELANAVVTTAKLQDAAVTLTKLAACGPNQTLRVTSAGAWQCTSSLTVLDNGRVGIGTTSPTALLDVNGTIKGGGVLAGMWHTSPTDDVAISAPGFVDIPNTSITFNLDRPARVFAMYSINVQPAGATTSYLMTRLTVDGSASPSTAQHFQPYTSGDSNVGLTSQLVVPLAAGSHTIALQWSPSDGSVSWGNAPSGWCGGTCASRALTVMAFYQ